MQIQRLQPRDLYDIWYLLEKHGLEIEFYTNEFLEKCELKGIDGKVFHANLKKRIPQYQARWSKSMNDQIQNLPLFEMVQRELNRHWKKFKL